MLPLHVGGDLDPRHIEPVDKHMKTCLSCFREFRELAVMRGRLGVLAEAPLPRGILDGFAEEVMARIAVGEPGPAAEAPGPSGILRMPLLPGLAAAAAVLIVSFAGWRLMSGDGELRATGRNLVDTAMHSVAAEPVVSNPIIRPLSLQAPVPVSVPVSVPASVPASLPASVQPSGVVGLLPEPCEDCTTPHEPTLQGLQSLSQEELLILQKARLPGVLVIMQQARGQNGLAEDGTGRMPRQRDQ